MEGGEVAGEGEARSSAASADAAHQGRRNGHHGVPAVRVLDSLDTFVS